MLNLSQVQAQTNEVLPAGKYEAVIVGAEVKATKSGGEMLQVEFTITGPTQAKRKVWDTYNIKHPTSTKAVEIGLSQLKALCEAAKIPNEKLTNFHPNMLANQKVTFETIIEKNEQYGDRAKVKRFIKEATKPAPSQFEATQDQIPF